MVRRSFMVFFTILTVLAAGALGGAVAVGVTALVVAAAIVLSLFALFNGLRIVAGLWSDVSPD